MKLAGRKRSLVVTALLVGGILVAAGVILPREPGAGAGSEAAPRLRVRVVTLRRVVRAGVVEEGGFLKARRDVTISAERPGRVVGFPV
ncbi:MAG: hypothetical protein ACE5JG_02930, partial [Planctomycetota bacterium]